MKQKGFTLVELLVVIAIIGLLSSVVLVSLNSAREKARDARRLEDIKTIQTALEMYLDQYEKYPGNTDSTDCAGWDTGYKDGPNSGDHFIPDLETTEILTRVPGDPTADTWCGGYRYHLYPAGIWGCPSSRGDFYVLIITDMETTGNPHPSSPGWKCPGLDWQTAWGGVDWVTGAFEK